VFEAASAQSVKALNVGSGLAHVADAGGLKALTVGDGTTATPLAIASAGRLDIHGNGLIVRYANGQDSAALVSVRDQIVRSYNATPALNDGAWDGNGIVSSVVTASPSERAIGYGRAATVLAFDGQTPGTFLGTTGVSDDSVLVRMTLAGDATLDGTVDFNDLVQLAQNYNTTVSDTTDAWWTSGDFTYDGVTDFNDLVKLAQNYNTSLPSAGALAGQIPGATASFDTDLAAAFALADGGSGVPEPTGVAGLALAALALLRRRNRGGRRAA
jgi:hypothetical protein